MPTKSTHLKADDIGKLIALLAVMLGGFIYLYQPGRAGFPINDGGLFYAMIRDLQANGFRWPAFVQYNGIQIPFAYPPFGFYVAGLLSSLLRVDAIVIVQWFPAVVLIGVSLAVYLLALRILGSPVEAGLATFLYVCTPRSMTWLIMGGGVTRSLGQLFLVLTLASIYMLYTDHGRKYLGATMLFGALVVITHPEAALHTAAGCVLIWLFKGRARQGLQDSILVGLGVLALSAVWWLPVLMRYGMGPLVSAGQTGLHTSIVFIYPLTMSIAEEPMMTVIAVLGTIGLLLCVARREYLLPVWLFLPFLVEPRGAATVAIIPLALMGARALHRLILPGLSSVGEEANIRDSPAYLKNTPARILLGYLGTFLIVMALLAGMRLATVSLSAANRAAFQWIAANTPRQSRFLILTGDAELFCDPVQEWFPVLTGRVSETTIQGQEWTSNGAFFSRVGGLQDLQKCLNSASPAECMQKPLTSLDLQYDYVYVATRGTAKEFCRPTRDEYRGAALLLQLKADPAYTEVYSSDAVEIFAHRP